MFVDNIHRMFIAPARCVGAPSLDVTYYEQVREAIDDGLTEDGVAFGIILAGLVRFALIILVTQFDITQFVGSRMSVLGS